MQQPVNLWRCKAPIRFTDFAIDTITSSLTVESIYESFPSNPFLSNYLKDQSRFCKGFIQLAQSTHELLYLHLYLLFGRIQTCCAELPGISLATPSQFLFSDSLNSRELIKVLNIKSTAKFCAILRIQIQQKS